MTTFTVLELSTAHVDRDTAALLDGLFHRDEPPRDTDHWSYWLVGSPGLYGWWIWADIEDGLDELPSCLRECLKLAREAGCRWIQFDCDVAPVAELTQYEW